MKLGALALVAIWAPAACSDGELSSVGPRDTAVLRSILAPSCERVDGKYLVLSSQPASDDHWGIPDTWDERAWVGAELRRRSGLQLRWLPIDLCAGVRFAAAETIDATFEEDSRIPAGWDNFYKQFPGSSGFIKVSLPAFSSAGDKAFVLVERGCRLLCGQGLYIRLQKEGGSWKVSGIETAWIA